MWFSLPHVVFAEQTQHEDLKDPKRQLSFALWGFRQCTKLYLKKNKAACFLQKYQLQAKEAISALWVNSAERIALHRLFKLLHLCTLVFLGTFLFDPFSVSSTFFDTTLALSAPCASFLETSSCSKNIFFTISSRTSAQNQEKHLKLPKMGISSHKWYVFRTKHSLGPRYNSEEAFLTCTRFRVEKGAISIVWPTISHRSNTFGHRGCSFAALFLHI